MIGTTGTMSRPSRQLPSVESYEHEVLAVLTEAGEAMTPGEVRDALGDELAYTTVMTTLSRMSEKGILTRRRTGRSFAYRAVVDEDEIAARQMQRLLATRDDRAAVLSRFVGTLSDDDERLLADLVHSTDPDGEHGTTGS